MNGIWSHFSDAIKGIILILVGFMLLLYTLGIIQRILTFIIILGALGMIFYGFVLIAKPATIVNYMQRVKRCMIKK